MREDIPLPFGVPAAALKYAPCRVSRLRAVNDCFQAQGITFRANRECRVSRPCHMDPASGRSDPMPSLSHAMRT
jgi:hypothetical protein